MNLLSHDKNIDVLSSQIQAMTEHGIDPKELLIIAPKKSANDPKEVNGVEVQQGTEDPITAYNLSSEEPGELKKAIENGEYLLLADEKITYSDEFFE